MGLDRRQLYRQAMREVERRRQQAESRALQNRRALYEAQPALAELDARITAAGVAAARLATEGQTDAAAEKLAELRALNQEKEHLLGSHAQAIQPQYYCVLCKDTGRHQGGVCSCVLDEELRLRREEINHASPLTLCRFENFVLERYPEKQEDSSISPRVAMQAIYQDCVDWAREFGPHNRSLLMYGDAGLGKTHLALSIASVVLDNGWDVIYVSAQRAFATISEERFGDNALFSSMLEADLLVLDDLGTEYMDAYVHSKLYELINARMNRRPTIYTTNICQQKALVLRYDEKIASRLLGDCHPMRFWGKDLRLHR